MVDEEGISGNDIADFAQDDFEYFEIDESTRAVLKDAVDEAIAIYAKSNKSRKLDVVEFKRWFAVFPLSLVHVFSLLTRMLLRPINDGLS